MAFKEAVRKADPCLMEPMMKVEIIVPDQYLGDVMGNVSSRRGRVDGTEVRGQDQIIHAYVPLSEMFGYTTDLRSRTQGRGMFTMQFDHYEEVPKSVAEKIIGRTLIIWRSTQTMTRVFPGHPVPNSLTGKTLTADQK